MKFNDEIEAMDEAYVAQHQQRNLEETRDLVQQEMSVVEGPMGLPTYPLALAQAEVAEAAAGSFLTRPVGPLPVWGWGLTVAGLGALGYFVYRSTKEEVTPNDGESEPRQLPASTGSGKWEPSRGAFADQLRPWLDQRGLGKASTVYETAEDAAKKLKHVSPLVTMKCTAEVPLKDLEKFCKAEGLLPIAHEGGVIGFYPGTGKRGKAWEDYVDLLRDDDQEV